MIQRTNNYTKLKNNAFIFLVIVGFTYLLFLIGASIKIFPVFWNQFLLSIFYHNDFQAIFQLCTSSFFIQIGFITIILIILWVKMAIAGVKMILSKIYSDKFIKNQKFLIQNQYRVIKSEKNLIFTYGLIKPQIYISNQVLKILKNGEKQAVLLHEQNHKNSKDPLKKVVILFIKGFLPPFPGKSSLFDSYDVLTELSSDEYAINQLEEKSVLFEALKKVIILGDFDNQQFLTGFAFRNDRLEILTKKRKFTNRRFFGILVLVVITILFGNSAIASSEIKLQCNQIDEYCNKNVDTTENQLLYTPQNKTSVCEVLNYSPVNN